MRNHQAVFVSSPVFRKLIALVLFLIPPVLLIPSLSAQILYGSLTGNVSDATGAAIPGVTVTILNQDTGETHKLVTDSSGGYLARNLLPAAYSVSIAASGNFGGYTRQNIHISANVIARVDVTLQAASVQSEVTVTATIPLLQTDSADVSHHITETQLNSIPITSTQGRQFQALYTIVPGAAAVAEQNSTASNPSRAMSANFNGISYNGNTTRIDGAVNYYGWLPYLVAYVPPADSIESVNVVTNSFNAEQGIAGGAAINVTTKSGTRNLHGSVWEYYQGSAFNARAYTATVQALPNVPKNIFNQFGFNVGGPVYIPHVITGRKKLF
ncbi:MAG: carboxypeptidase-like regulatory domain-containing protein, partial [Acidobacteriaceae bacterium]|nr:carboxypeptidase-like regulatory domain-containing protein [Acidobacteriaceae bacterium]